jgi:hypothetical protein
LGGGWPRLPQCHHRRLPQPVLHLRPQLRARTRSALVYVEAQLKHIATAVRLIVDRDLRRLEVRADRERAENDELQRRLAGTTWNSGCASWYLTPDGHNATTYPGFATQYVRSTRRVELDDYEMTRSVT